MELPTPDRIELDDDARDALHAVRRAVAAADELRPLAPETLRRLREDRLGETVFASNALEGSTLDQRETAAVLRQGALGDGREREEAEARNLAAAVRAAGDWIEAGEPCHDAGRLREIHAIVLCGIDDAGAGRFRTGRVIMRGAARQPPPETALAALVDGVMRTAEAPSPDLDPVVLAAWTHWAIARIHPFPDANGRVARLWQDLVLARHGLPGAIIRPEHRPEYLAALGAADEGEFSPLVRLVAERVVASLARLRAAALRVPRVCADRRAVKAWLDAEKAAGKTVVFACGCFELLHVGHVRYLTAAREEGDLLVVAVNTDASIARIKPGRRPVNPDHERFEMLAALRPVDVVVPLTETTPIELIRYLQPDVHTKGTDYTLDRIPERAIVESYGGRVAIVGDPKEHSTTDMLRAIREE